MGESRDRMIGAQHQYARNGTNEPWHTYHHVYMYDRLQPSHTQEHTHGIIWCDNVDTLKKVGGEKKKKCEGQKQKGKRKKRKKKLEKHTHMLSRRTPEKGKKIIIIKARRAKTERKTKEKKGKVRKHTHMRDRAQAERRGGKVAVRWYDQPYDNMSSWWTTVYVRQ